MLSAEKAKLRSAFESTKSQMQSEIIVKQNPSQMRGTSNNLIINLNIFLMLKAGTSMEFIADFKNNWFIVSHMLVSMIKKRIKSSFGCILSCTLLFCA
jgi:hypothetical protein